MQVVFLVFIAFIIILVGVMIYGLCKVSKTEWKFNKDDIIFYAGKVYMIVGRSSIITPTSAFDHYQTVNATPSYLLLDSETDSVTEEDRHLVEAVAILKSDFDQAVEEMNKLENRVNKESENKRKDYKR